ncbi:MAG TPA: S8 family peptidase [Longimicrobium sp.]|jgi:subtilisin family serine protease|uniref:S8 family peptidase n=1 Tax=Longimicrobium sp. TaxID=2029185 RepID=UPI002EDA3B5A
MKLRNTSLLLGMAALAACSDQATEPVAARSAPVHFAANGRGIEGSYIVVLKEGADARAVAAVAGVTPQHVYSAALTGFSAELNAGQLNALRSHPSVDFVEEDQVATLSATQSGATWGIDRTDQRARPLSGTYNYTNTASNVRAYIIDTGVRATHAEFRKTDGTTRAQNNYNATGDGNASDCNGHGTHVAGTVGGKTYGIAKAVMIRAVKVFTCSGGSANSTIIAGIDWVTANHIKPAVANLSLGGGASQATDDAVNRLSNAGVFVAVAAGNSNVDACTTSPARASTVTTVASSTSSDAKSSFSNWGSCVELYAPGSSITSAWYQSDTQTNTISGTSMASPHVAGVGALYKGTYGDAGYSTIRTWLINNATTNVITGNVSGTPNRLLFKSTL